MTTTTAPPDTRWARLARILPVLAYAAGVTILASRGYHLAREALHMGHYVAAALPLLVDVYVIVAFWRRQDRAPAMAVLGAMFAAGVVVDAIAAGGFQPIHAAEVIVGAVVVVVMWRVAELVHHGSAAARERAAMEEKAARRAARRARRRSGDTAPEAEAPALDRPALPAEPSTTDPFPAAARSTPPLQGIVEDGFPAAPWPATDEGTETATEWARWWLEQTGELPSRGQIVDRAGGPEHGWRRDGRARTAHRRVAEQAVVPS